MSIVSLNNPIALFSIPFRRFDIKVADVNGHCQVSLRSHSCAVSIDAESCHLRPADPCDICFCGLPPDRGQISSHHTRCPIHQRLLSDSGHGSNGWQYFVIAISIWCRCCRVWAGHPGPYFGPYVRCLCLPCILHLQTARGLALAEGERRKRLRRKQCIQNAGPLEDVQGVRRR